MNYYERIQKSINFIENNLHEEISLDLAARKAFMSLSNYYRMFFSLTGHTVKEYIRRRRLSCASQELLNSNKNVLEIAVDYCFSNGDTFARTFKKITGYNPSTFKKNRNTFIFERINIMKKYFNEQETNDKFPEIRVLKAIPPMRVAYYNYVGESPEANTIAVISKWLKTSGLKFEKDNLRILGYNNPCPTQANQTYGYEICVTIPENYEVKSNVIKTKTLSGGLYAVQGVEFEPTSDGHEIIEAWRKFHAWLKDSKYRLGDQQWMEEHLNFNDDFEFIHGIDLYMPIQLK